jgi:hypothetical protein
MARVLLQWKEPKEFLKAIDDIEKAKEKPWHRPALALAFFAVLLILGFAARSMPEKELPPLAAMILMVTFLVWLIAWAVPWINERSSSNILLLNNALHKTQGSLQKNIPYRQLSYHYWLSTEQYHTLIIVPRARTHSAFANFFSIGVPDEETKNKAEAILISKKVRAAEGEERNRHFQAFTSPPPRFRWTRTLAHLTVTLTLIAACTWLCWEYPNVRALGILQVVLGVPFLYLVLALTISTTIRWRKDVRGGSWWQAMDGL